MAQHIYKNYGQMYTFMGGRPNMPLKPTTDFSTIKDENGIVKRRGIYISRELFESYLVTFHNIELFSDEDRNVVECLLLSVLHSMCRLQPSLYSFCLAKHIIPSLLSSKFLMKVDCTHFINQEEKSLIQSINQDQDGHDIITIFGIILLFIFTI